MKFKSKFIALLLALVIMSLAAFVVYAGLHFSGGPGFGSGSVIIDVAIAGFGNDLSTTTVTATITDGDNLTAICRNNGGNIAPGQNPVNITGISAAQSVNPSTNGSANAYFHIDVIESAGITWSVAGCPNKNWTVTDLLGGITINLLAANGTDSVSQNYSCYVNELDRIIACTAQ